MVDALVTDANQRVALEVARCLGREGLEVALVERTEVQRPLAFASSFATETKWIENYDSRKFREMVLRADAVFPISTNTHYELFPLSEELKRRTLLPDFKTFRRVNRKNELRETAQKAGLRVPDTVVRDPEEPLEDLGSIPDLPLVLKLADDEDLYLPPGERYEIARNENECRRAYDRLSRHGKSLLIQEYIDGDGYGYSVLLDSESRFVAGGAHHRLRELPVSGGPSTFCETVDVPHLKDQALTLLQSVDWVGPAMVEFRRRGETDQYYLLEVNPRYWGSLPLLGSAGLNVPYLHYRLITSKNITDTPRTPRPDEQLVFLAPDWVALAQASLQGKSSYGTVFGGLFAPLRSGVACGIFRRSDPRPFLRYLRQRLSEFWSDSGGP